jgi:hypothetical protein
MELAPMQEMGYVNAKSTNLPADKAVMVTFRSQTKFSQYIGKRF